MVDRLCLQIGTSGQMRVLLLTHLEGGRFNIGQWSIDVTILSIYRLGLEYLLCCKGSLCGPVCRRSFSDFPDRATFREIGVSTGLVRQT